MKTGILILITACFQTGKTATTVSTNNHGPGGGPAIPSGAALDKLVDGSFRNVDSDKDGYIESYEFDTLIIVADKNDDGCMSLEEYKGFSAGTPEIATKIYQHFDPDNSDCLTVDKVFSQFALMDTDNNKKVDRQEFETYYIKLLQMLFGQPAATIG